MSRLRVGVVGASGFLGGEVVRLLAQHPEVTLTTLCAGTNAGKRLSEVRPSLRGPADGLLESVDPDRLAERCELVVLGLPHGESARVGKAMLERGTRVIDLGSDFRLVRPADHQTYYGRDPGAPEWLERAVYSLPELTGPPPRHAELIANPGCYATAMSLALGPLTEVLAPDATVQVFGVTGSSGSGIKPSTRVHHALRSSDFRAYKTLNHQHVGEVRQLLAGRGHVPRIQFVPHSLPVVRGIHVTALVDRAHLTGDAAERFHAAYDHTALIDVVDGEVHMGAVLGSVRGIVGLSGDADTLVVFAAIDNLLKGGSGQAVQNLNLSQGWPETLGLPVLGSWP